MSEARYIDANLFSETLKKWCQQNIISGPVQTALSECPTVEPSVVHGEWANGYFEDFVCTACLHPSPLNKKTPFCPNCGAKMSGGKS